ncbi:PREDICTED: collagen alpha-1(I) chain [Propithecus coquereli]|uniref:collagen alpha-1(I) chain n=1 Tax=Propithecus coquereli TaxID=379532 RepID=UPI00063EED16|nr:PREDICTED: collagen alpha-1(I) chain [Propithecus coquereli]
MPWAGGSHAACVDLAGLCGKLWEPTAEQQLSRLSPLSGDGPHARQQRASLVHLNRLRYQAHPTAMHCARGGALSRRRPNSRKMCSARTPVDARALTKKLDRTACHPAARAVLGSLLLYVSSREDGPPAAGGCRPSRQPESQEATRRPTRFQLLQAKFLGAGREPHLKRTREVGRLTPRDRLGPGCSLVSATINKLLDKTKERAGGLPGEKPRRSPPTGKSAVKNILKKFLAAEEKEAQEKAARERPPAERPRAPRGLLPKVVGTSSVLSKLREKFEQSACLCSEAGLLPLHGGARKKRNLQRRKMHRPEVRVLHTATMASTCVRTPLARFLACTAEPLPALGVATVVCGPRSWLSRCSKISHAGARRQPGREGALRPDAGEAEPSGKGPLQGEPREQPQATAQRGGPAAADTALPCVGPDSPTLPGHLSALSLPSPLGLAGRRGDGTVRATAGSAMDGSWEVGDARAAGPLGEGAAEAPEVAMTVCSSEDEMPDSERDPLFATQKYFPEQNGPRHIPPLYAPVVRAARRAQPAVESPRITVQRPVVHEMPPAPASLHNAPPGGDARPRVGGGDTVVENAQAASPVVAGHRAAGRAAAELSEPPGAPAGPQTSSRRGAQADPSPAHPPGAAGADGSIPDAAPMQRPPRNPAGGKEGRGSFESPNSPENRKDISAESPCELRDAGCPGPESRATPKPGEGPSLHDPTTRKGHLGRNSCGPSGGQHAPSPGESGLTGAPTSQAAPPGGRVGPEGFATRGSDVLHRQEQGQWPPAASAQPLQVARGNASPDCGKNTGSSFDGRPKASVRAPREMAGAAGVAGHAPGHAPPLPANGRLPEHPGDEDGCGTPATGLRAAEGGGLRGQCLPQEPNDRHVWAPGGAAERSVFHGQAGAPAPHAEGAARSSPVPCASHESATRKSDAAVGGGNHGAGAGRPPGRGAEPAVPASTCRRPWGASPAGPSLGPGELPLPAENQLTTRREGAEWEKQLPSGTELAGPPPTAPTTEAEARRAGWAQQRSPPDARARQPPARRTPEAQSPGSEAQGCRPAQAGPVLDSQWGQESRPAPGRAASGCVRSRQTPQPAVSGRHTAPLGPEVVQNVAEQPRAQLRSAQDPATEVESPRPPSHRGQAGTLGPWAEQVRSPGQGQGTWAAKTSDTAPGSPEELGSLAAQGQPQGQVQGQPQGQVQGQQVQGQVQGQPQGQVQERPQGQVKGQVQGQVQGQSQKQPVVGAAGGTPAAGRSGGRGRPAPREDGQGDPAAPHLPQGSQPPRGESSAAPALEPTNGSAEPTPRAGGCQGAWAEGQGALLRRPGAQRGELAVLEQERRRKPLPLAKYRAQSFSDQRSFDLSFRPASLRASDTFDLPK